MVVRNQTKAEEISSIMDDSWLIISMGHAQALCGRGFEVILIVDQPIVSEDGIKRWQEYLGYLRTKLLPNGKLIEVY